ncbi:transcription termination factor MTERF4, chloroplastic-like [Triticum urartu]|uniref:mTERF domain-containing protein 1, mitochondrial n=1 Tax=Triticum urartu TaxID=4572 RepID=A0A8R7UQG1_TRIUA|nr:transcription termination factor MTERF4, chloroplastic-like [Triticum urartu]
MLRLHKYVLTQLLPSSSASASAISPLSRLISAAAPAVSPNPSCFAVEEYLVATCGLTRPQAAKASAKLSHLKSPAKPDAVLAFLAGLGLSGADVAALVAKDPQLLCAGVEKTLAPNVAGLTGLGLSPSEIARLVWLSRNSFRSRSIVSKLQYYLPLFGSSEHLLRAFKRNPYLLSSDLEGVVKPNVAYLHECGLGACDIAKLCISRPGLLVINPERFQDMVAYAENIGVPCGSGMFSHALHAVACFSKEEIAARVDYLKNTFMWTDAEVGIAVSKAPLILTRSKESLQRRSEFLISKVGLEPAYIACRPTMLTYSLEGRLRPRYYVVKFLKESGLLDHDRGYFGAVTISEKVFVKKFICPHKDAAPHLAEDYATACRGEVPARFSFT